MSVDSHVTHALLFFSVAVVSYVLVALARWSARRCNILDVPNERSSHIYPTPAAGGLALIAVNTSALLFLQRLHPLFSTQHLLALMGAGLLVAGVSFVDDLGHVPYILRLAIHGTAAAIVVAFFSYWQVVTLPVLGTLSLGFFGVGVTLLWIVGLTNAYNFIDGIDGLAGSQALAAGLGWVVLGSLVQRPVLSVLGLLLAASSLGFLVHNWHPATIFMGDVGATFLGFCYAVIPVFAAQYDPRLALAGVLLVWPAIFDSGFTVTRRLLKRQSIFSGHRSFLFHRLVAAGWSHSAAASLYFALPLAGGALAYFWVRGNPAIHLAVLLLLLGLCLSLWLFVGDQERRAPSRPVAATQAEIWGREGERIEADRSIALEG